MVATETVVINTTTNVGGVVKQGSNQLALLAPIEAGATVSANVVKTYRRASDAADDFGAGNLMSLGVADALGAGIRKVFAVGVDKVTGSPFTETYGDADIVSDSSDTGADVLQNLPATSITSVDVDGTPNTIVYTSGDPLLEAPPADTIHINMDTGAWKIGTATTGSGSGVVIVYAAHDWDAAFSKLDLESYECHVPAGYAYSEQYHGVYQKFLTHAATENKVVVTALESGVTPADVEAHVERTRNGRLKVYAAYYTGDGTSAFAANEMLFAVNATTKEQPAPRSLVFTDTYVRSEFGDEETPSNGTFHEMGVNAVFRDRGGAYRITNDRASTGLTEFERFFSTRRSIRLVQNELTDDLLAARRGNGTALPFTQSGIDKAQRILENTLSRMRSLGIIDQGFVTMPELGDVTETDRLDRTLRGIEVSIRLTGQIHLFVINLNVGV